MRRVDSSFAGQSLRNRQARQGNYMFAMFGFMPVFIGFAALAVDISYIGMSRTQAQNAADAASHAAFIAYRATAGGESGNDPQVVGDAAAEYVMARNLVGGAPAELIDVQYGNWDFDDQEFTTGGFINSARAIVERSETEGNAIPLFFAPLLGYDTWDVDGRGVTAGLTREILIVHDVSGSFAGAIEDASNASRAFLQYMGDNPYAGDRVGMVIFGGARDNGWNTNNSNKCNNTSLNDLNFPLFDGLTPPSGYDDMDDHWDRLATAPTLDQADNPNQIVGGRRCKVGQYTSQFRGVNQAHDVFEDEPNVGGGVFRAIILVSDGLPTCNNTSCDANSSTIKAAGKTLTTASVNNIFNQEGVHVWTLFFYGDAANPQNDIEYMASLKRGYGKAYETPEEDELDDIMLEIAASIPVVLAD